jgi:hypothetical protein
MTSASITLFARPRFGRIDQHIDATRTARRDDARLIELQRTRLQSLEIGLTSLESLGDLAQATAERLAEIIRDPTLLAMPRPTEGDPVDTMARAFDQIHNCLRACANAGALIPELQRAIDESHSLLCAAPVVEQQEFARQNCPQTIDGHLSAVLSAELPQLEPERNTQIQPPPYSVAPSRPDSPGSTTEALTRALILAAPSTHDYMRDMN